LVVSYQLNHVTSLSALSLAACVVCMLVTPAGGAVACYEAGRLSELSVWTGSVFAMSLTFMMLYGLWTVAHRLASMHQQAAATTARSACTDRTALLPRHYYQSLVSSSYSNQPITVATNGSCITCSQEQSTVLHVHDVSVVQSA